MHQARCEDSQKNLLFKGLKLYERENIKINAFESLNSNNARTWTFSRFSTEQINLTLTHWKKNTTNSTHHWSWGPVFAGASLWHVRHHLSGLCSIWCSRQRLVIRWTEWTLWHIVSVSALIITLVEVWIVAIGRFLFNVVHVLFSVVQFTLRVVAVAVIPFAFWVRGA